MTRQRWSWAPSASILGVMLACGASSDDPDGSPGTDAMGVDGCVPMQACEFRGAECGVVAGVCGAVDCGECSLPLTCGGGGAANVCGCSPKSCADQGLYCGQATDGCGEPLDCGEPATGYVLHGPFTHGPVEGNSVEIVDISLDGRNDLLVSTGEYDDPLTDNHLLVFRQSEDGSLLPPQHYPYYNSVPPECPLLSCRTLTAGLATADLDADGALDVVVGHYFGVTSFRNSGMGSLEEGVLVARASPYLRDQILYAGDVDLDGDVDILSACESSCDDEFAVYFGDGTGGLSASSFAVERNRGQFLLADLTGDGLQDLVTRSIGVDVFPHNSDGYFEWSVSEMATSLGEIEGFAIGDVSDDGLVDIVATGWLGSSLQVARGDDSGGFSGAEPVYGGVTVPKPEEVRIADLDGDGRNDIVVVHGGFNRITVYLQSELGEFPTVAEYPIPYATSYGFQSVAIGDINSDDCPDVAIAEYNHGLVVSYGVCRDSNCDGVIDGSDLAMPGRGAYSGLEQSNLWTNVCKVSRYPVLTGC